MSANCDVERCRFLTVGSSTQDVWYFVPRLDSDTRFFASAVGAANAWMTIAARMSSAESAFMSLDRDSDTTIDARYRGVVPMMSSV